MKLGTAPITWGVCEMEGWGERMPFGRVLDEMAQLGYRGTELGPIGYLPGVPTVLRGALRRRNLALMAAFCPVVLHVPGGLERAWSQASEIIDLLSEVGGELLVLADAGSGERLAKAGRVAPDGSDGFVRDEWQRFAEGVHEIARQAATKAIRTVLHPEAGSYIETPAEIDEALSWCEPDLVDLCLDTGHVTYGGGDASTLAQRYASRIRHVHAKDVDPAVLARVRSSGLSYWEAAAEGIFAPVGAGCVDFAGVLDALRAAEYRGWLIVEQDVRLGAAFRPQDPLGNARASKAALEALLA